MIPAGAFAFSAHNIQLPDGTETFPGRELVADSAIMKEALKSLALAFPSGPEGVTVADLGCLEGGHSAAFAQAGYSVTGIEVRRENFLCCEYVRDRLALPGLQFVHADARVAILENAGWDAVFCCGLLYHLENPAAFLRQLGYVTRRLLIVQTHYSTRPDAEHEGYRGHWYDEPGTRWSSWKNSRSFWLARPDLLTVLREAGFGLVYEQPAGIAKADPSLDARSMFIGVKL